ncbi:hypothetical protein JCM30760_08740 [Thiomicrorhabdus hydrogeniphila]
MEAIFKESLKRVAKRIMVGKTAKSNGLLAYKVTINTTNERAILNVKNISNKNGGSGIVTIPNRTKTAMGTPKLLERLVLALLIS